MFLLLRRLKFSRVLLPDIRVNYHYYYSCYTPFPSPIINQLMEWTDSRTCCLGPEIKFKPEKCVILCKTVIGYKLICRLFL